MTDEQVSDERVSDGQPPAGMAPGLATGPLGFIGLGNMGGPMSANLVAGLPQAGQTLVVHDAAGSAERAPAGADPVADVAGVARAAAVVFLSLPDGPIVEAVADAIAGTPTLRTRVVVDLSTIGVEAAESTAAALAQAGIAYLDAPVSGGVAGAKAASLALMAAGDRALFDELEGLLGTMAAHPFYVGERPGQGQAMKLLNNYLSATAQAASAEALLFGEGHGLAIATMLDVLNAASGRNTATADKLPRVLLRGEERLGFTAALMRKDVRLYLARAESEGMPRSVASSVGAMWEAAAAASTGEGAGADVAALYPLLRDGRLEAARDA